MSQDTGERFRVRRETGRGKRAVVYEAYDTLLHRPVALKTTHTHAGKRFLVEEAQRLARVRNRYVVAIYDLIPDSGNLVLEWLAGSTLRQRLQNNSPLAFDEVRRWTSQLLTAIGAAHEVDVVHGDIKPENIWIDEQNQLKLFDFGMTPRAGGDATALYAPPEVLNGDEHSAQSDLYCVGSVVFELLTGHPPFDSSSIDELAQRKTRSTAPQISRSGGTANEQVEAWVGRALQSDPRYRFDSADAAREEWTRAARSMRNHASVGTTPGTLHPQSQAELQSAFTAPGATSGSVITVTGVAGIGKTELLRQLLHRLPTTPAAIELHGCADHQEPLSTWHQAAHSFDQSTFAGDTADEIIASFERRIHDPNTLREVLILVDDFGQCDAQSRSLLLRFARHACRLRVGLVATTRRTGLQDALSDWCALEDCATRSLSLTIPTKEALQQALADTQDGSEIPDALAAYLHAVSGGNPRYATHVFDDLRTQGFVQRTESSLSFSNPPEDRVPERSLPYLEQSLAALPRSQRDTLVEAALHGSTFTTKQLSHRLDSKRAIVVQEVHDLVHQTDLLISRDGVLSFATPLLQLYLESTVAPERRQQVHGEIADWLVQHPKKEVGALGFHLFHAGRLAEALKHLLAAGRAALEQHELEIARRHLHMALLCIDSEPASEEDARLLAELLLLQAQTLAKLANWDAAFALIDRCLLQARAWGLQQQEVQAIRWRGRIQYKQGRFEAAVQTLRQAQALATSSQDDPEAHELALQIGNIDFELGRLDAALEGYMAALLYATENGDPELEARASNNVALVYSTMGDKPQAIRMFGRSLKLFRGLHREDAVAHTQHNIGMAYLDLHNWREARNYFRDSMELSLRLGLDEIASVARLEHAETNLRLGRIDEAKPDVDKALTLCEQRDDPLGTATAYRLKGMIAAHEGDTQKAEIHLQRSIELLRGLGETPHLGVALKERGRARMDAGDLSGALASFEEARRIFETLETPHEGLDEVIALWEACQKVSG